MGDTDTNPTSSGAYKRLNDELQRVRARHGDERAVMYFELVGRPLRLTAIGQTLLWDLSAALRHLIAPPPDPELPMLVIDAWQAPEGDDAADLDNLAPSSLRFVVHRESSYSAVLDLDRNHMLVRVERMNNSFAARPMSEMLWAWLRRFDLHELRGAVVEKYGHGLVLCGAKGCGLSALSLQCLESGFRFASDGRALLQRTEGGFVAHSLYSSISLAPELVRRFEHWREYTRSAYRPRIGHDMDHRARVGNEKSLVVVADGHPERIIDTVPVSAVVVVLSDEERTGPPVVVPLLREAVLSSLVGERSETDTVDRGDMHSEVFALTRLTPCFGLVRRNPGEDVIDCLNDMVARIV